MSARASGDLDVVRRLLAGALFRAALRVVRVAFFVARFADPFVERLALFAVLRTCLRVRLAVFRVLRAAFFALRLPAFRALRAALFVVVVAFFAGMSCSSTLDSCDPIRVPASTLAWARQARNHPIGCFVPRTPRARLATSLGGVARENSRFDAVPPASCSGTILLLKSRRAAVASACQRGSRHIGVSTGPRSPNRIGSRSTKPCRA